MRVKPSQKKGTIETHTSRGLGLNFAEVRAYQHGDDTRNIDWRVTARTNRMHTKIFHEDKSLNTFIAFDRSPYTHFGTQSRFKSLAITELSSLLAWDANEKKSSIGCLAFGNKKDYFFLQPKRNSIFQILNQLSTSPNTESPNTNTPISYTLETLQKTSQTLPKKSKFYLIADLSTLLSIITTKENLLKTLNQHHKLYCFAIYDPIEASIPKGFQYTFSDGITPINFDGNNKQKRVQYATIFKQNKDKLISFAQKQHINIELFSTNQTTLPIVQRQLLHY